MRIQCSFLGIAIFVLSALPFAGGQARTSSAPPPKRQTTSPNPNPSATPGTAPGNTPGTGEQPKSTDKTGDAIVRLERARIDAIDANQESISLTDCIPGSPDPQKIVCQGKSYHLKVSDQALRAKVKLYHVGDQVRATIKGGTELQDVPAAWSYPPEGVSAYCRILILAACALALFGFAAAVTKGKPLAFIVGADYRYSNSKFQLALWFWVVISTYVATVIFRVWWAGWDFFGAVDIPQNLLVLSGLSAISYGGAKAITTAKVDAAANPVTPPGGVPRAANNDPKNAAGRQAGQERFFQDLLQNDFGQFDFGDFQMLMVTMIAVVMYVTLIFHFLGKIDFVKTASLPDVDTTILAGFGLGQGAYLAKKAGGDPGKT